LTTVPELAAKILDVFRKESKSRGASEIPTTHLYATFEREATHDMIQASIRYLLDRDFIAPHTYSLTAKGMVKQVGTERKTEMTS
jgi:hypothetical protein